MAAIAKAAIVHPPSPSPFATLLRRSKFASYDPTIGQVYTTHDGNAHRGNWGFKRPLALRKRDKFISVQVVDSPEQQTEWKPRESEARFVQRWGEVATEPNVRGAWEKHYMNSRPMHQGELAKVDKNGSVVDPAVQRQAEESSGKRQYVASGPLISAMSAKQFARYLDKLHKQRPEGAGRTRKPKAPSQHLVAPSAYEESALGSAEMVRRRFLQRQSHTLYEAPDSRVIEQRPHRNGGLSYAHASQLTHFFTTRGEPGRFIDSQGPEGRPNVRAGFAGMAANLKTPVIDYDSGSKFRVVDSVLQQAPNVVSAQPQGLDGAIIEMTVQDVGNHHMTRANPFPPGSRAYIAHTQKILPSKGKRTLTVSNPIPQRETVPEAEVTQELLSTLRNIIHKMPYGGDQKPQ
ncbi:mitochondrial ribosomal protein subunit-domain-containing protein [Lactifluus subvellereus]|nr:mitochondrial ribosomal protein subunit-domain-containing protein [Lactifluus subvellereus]